MNALSGQVGDLHDRPPWTRLVHVVVYLVPRTRWASVSLVRNGRFATTASTGETADRADALQYELGSGPCVDAVLEGGLRVATDVPTDERWIEWGQRVARDLGVRSAMAQRLVVPEHGDFRAGLSIYSDRPAAFDQHAVDIVAILATHAARVVGESLAQERAEHLTRALESNREIGVAMGILMHEHRFTREQAFDVLRVASRNSNRRLTDLAVEVVEMGTLPTPQRLPST